MANPSVSVLGSNVKVSGPVNDDDTVQVIIKDSGGNVVVDSTQNFPTGGLKTSSFNVTPAGTYTVKVIFNGGFETTSVTVPTPVNTTFLGSND